MNRRFAMIPVLVATAALAIAGCNTDEPVAGSDTDDAATLSVATIPALQDIRGAVTMDDADATVVAQALDEWRATTRTAGKKGRFAMHRGGMQFVAAVAPSLDNDQLSDLAGFLVGLREQHRQEVRGQFRGGRGNGRQFEQMIKDLDLSADQEEQMRALHTEMQAAMKQLRAAFKRGEFTDEAFGDAMDALHDAHREKLAAVLTADQMEKRDRLREQRRAQMREHRRDRIDDGVATRLAWLTAVLNLDDAQQAQVRTVLEHAAQERAAAMDAAGDAPRRAMHAEMRATREKTHEAIREVLTEQQKERLEIVATLRGPGTNRP